MKMEDIEGQPSWKLQAKGVTAHLTQLGGHLGPVTFQVGRRKIQPYSVNPWAKEETAPDLPPIVKVLRGDLFCFPFGLNQSSVGGKDYPVHGETANAPWELESIERKDGAVELEARLEMTIRSGTVRKIIRLEDDHPAVYCRHVIEGFRGKMNFGHHAMLKFPVGAGTGRVSTSPIRFGQVCPEPFEDPAMGGYSSLRPGARFSGLDRVPLDRGGYADLTRYPAREGFDDLVMLVSKRTKGHAWSAVTFPSEGYVWFSLKDPAVLRQTVMWHSNGGRHYAPWNGRHRGVLGLEEITGYFHFGAKESLDPNPLSEAGIPTSHAFKSGEPYTVNTIMAVAPAPAGFDRVADIELKETAVLLKSFSGKSVEVPMKPSFLTE